MLLIACNVNEEIPPNERDLSEVGDLVEAVQPHKVMSLALDPEGTLQLGDVTCRDPIDEDEDTVSWSGPCLLDDGALLEGELTQHSTSKGVLLSAENLTISQGDRTEVMLSGAIELKRRDDLVQLDVSVQGCGTVGPSCDSLAQGGSFGIDLDFSLYPADTFPSVYSATVSGAVGRTDAIVGVEGTWQVDTDQCAIEATDGTLAFGTYPRQTLELDGATGCDGCAGWRIEGLEVPDLCDVPVF